MPIPRSTGQAATLATGFWIYDALSTGSGLPRRRRVSIAGALAANSAPTIRAAPGA